jgi:hypothetical protein
VTREEPGQDCHYCGGQATTRDHRVPRLHCITLERFQELGRGEGLRAYHAARRLNIVAACEDCNNRKSNRRARCGCDDCTVSWELLAPPGWRYQWWKGPKTARMRRKQPMTQTIAEAAPLAWADRWLPPPPREVTLDEA